MQAQANKPYAPPHPTYRQIRLLAWMRNPRGIDDLPTGPAIDWSQASWTAAELVARAGIYDSRDACLYDLRALLKRGFVGKHEGNPARWRLLKERELGA